MKTHPSIDNARRFDTYEEAVRASIACEEHTINKTVYARVECAPPSSVCCAGPAKKWVVWVETEYNYAPLNEYMETGTSRYHNTGIFRSTEVGWLM